jgi:hypothetical protein
MKSKAQYKQNEPLEQLPTTRPGDKVVRIRRKRRGIFHAIWRNVSRFFKRTASK